MHWRTQRLPNLRREFRVLGTTCGLLDWLTAVGETQFIGGNLNSFPRFSASRQWLDSKVTRSTRQTKVRRLVWAMLGWGKGVDCWLTSTAAPSEAKHRMGLGCAFKVPLAHKTLANITLAPSLCVWLAHSHSSFSPEPPEQPSSPELPCSRYGP